MSVFRDHYGLKDGWFFTFFIAGMVGGVFALMALTAMIDHEEWTRIDGDCFVRTVEDNRFLFRTVDTQRTVYCEVQR